MSDSNTTAVNPNDPFQSNTTKILGGAVDVGNKMLAGAINMAEDQLIPEIQSGARTWLEHNRGMFGRGPLAGIGYQIADKAVHSIPYHRVGVGVGQSVLKSKREADKLVTRMAQSLTATGHNVSLAGMMSYARTNEVAADELGYLRDVHAGDHLSSLAALPSAFVSTILNVQPNGHNTAATGHASPPAGIKATWKGVDFSGIPLVGQVRNKLGELARSARENPNSTGLMVKLGGSSASQFLASKVDDMQKRRATQRRALPMIEHLTKMLNEDPGTDRIENMNHRGTITVASFVHEIFVTHSARRGEPAFGRLQGKKLDEACVAIADALHRGRLNPEALEILVGERKIVHSGGLEIAGKSEVTKEIERVCHLMPVHYNVDKEDYWDKSLLTKEENESLLKTLKGDDRDFWIARLPREVLVDAGLELKEITEAKQRADHDFAKNLAAEVRDMNTMHDKELPNAGFDRKQVAMLREVASRIEGKPDKAILEFTSRFGEFDKGIEFLTLGNVAYQHSIAAGELKRGDLSKAKPLERGKHPEEGGHPGHEEDRPHASERASPRSFADRVGRSRSASPAEEYDAPKRHVLAEGRHHDGSTPWHHQQRAMHY